MAFRGLVERLERANILSYAGTATSFPSFEFGVRHELELDANVRHKIELEGATARAESSEGGGGPVGIAAAVPKCLVLLKAPPISNFRLGRYS